MKVAKCELFLLFPHYYFNIYFMLPFLKEYVSDLFSSILENSHFYRSFPFKNYGFFFYCLAKFKGKYFCSI